MAKRGRKRKYKKREQSSKTLTAETIIIEVEALKQAYIDNLMKIRTALIKSTNEVRDFKNSTD